MRFYFKPTLALTLVVLILLPLLISLGFWQLHRADEKQRLQAKFDMRSKMMPITVDQAKSLPDNNYYPVQIEGHFDNVHQFLLDNQFYHHRVGYQLITPFISEKTRVWILINRGWLPAASHRNILPKIPVVAGKIHLTGFLYTPQNNPFISDEIEATSWPLRIERLNMDVISKQLNRTFYPHIILLNPDSPYGLIRNWQPVNMKASMHRGYAVQWFSMAGALFIIYVGMSFKRKINP